MAPGTGDATGKFTALHLDDQTQDVVDLVHISKLPAIFFSVDTRIST